jgi:zinc transporter ZupT
MKFLAILTQTIQTFSRLLAGIILGLVALVVIVAVIVMLEPIDEGRLFAYLCGLVSGWLLCLTYHEVKASL